MKRVKRRRREWPGERERALKKKGSWCLQSNQPAANTPSGGGNQGAHLPPGEEEEGGGGGGAGGGRI